MDIVKVLDLPAIPEEFISECYDRVHERTEAEIMVQNGGLDFAKSNKTTGTMPLYEIEKNLSVEKYKEYVANYQKVAKYVEWEDGSQKRICTIKRYPFSDKFHTWLKENIYNDLDKIDSFQLGHQMWWGGEVIWPHTDKVRNFLLSYLVEEGGDNVELSFWKYNNEHLILKPYTHFFKFDKLEMIKKLRRPVGRWVLADTRVAHAVHFMDKPRIDITIGLLTPELDPFLKQHNIDFKY